MSSPRIRWATAMLLAGVLLACGEHSSTSPRAPTITPDGAAPMPTPIETPPTPGIETTPSPTPTQQQPESLLAVAMSFGVDVDGIPVADRGVQLLRHDRTGWQEIAVDALDELVDPWVYGTSFSSATTAWAFGQVGFENGPPLILRSDDAGMTWRNVTDEIFAERSAGLVRFMLFSDASNGWLAAPPQLSGIGPNRFGTRVTRDGGKTWQRVEDCNEIRLCAGRALCELAPVGGEPFPLGPAPGSEAYCMPTFPAQRDLGRASDARANGVGLRCGILADAPGTPVCERTADAGSTWAPIALPPQLVERGTIYVTSLVLTDDGEAWATVNGTLSDPPLLSRFMHSSDGGQTWQLDDIRRNTTLGGLSRSSITADRGWSRE